MKYLSKIIFVLVMVLFLIVTLFPSMGYVYQVYHFAFEPFALFIFGISLLSIAGIGRKCTCYYNGKKAENIKILHQKL